MLTQRLGSATQKNDDFIDFFIETVRSNPGSCDEVWLASDYGFPPLEVHKRSAKKLSEIAEKMRNNGLRVSLQISNTVGHGRYMCSCNCSGLVYDGSPVRKMVGHDGTVADYCFCFNDSVFLDYVTAEIREYAKIKPYCVWIDDDLRATNHNPVSFGCFCEHCIRIFNEKYGYNYEREALVNEINFGKIKVREDYVDFLRSSLYNLTYAMSKAVHDISPESSMGFQYCAHGGYTGYGYDFIFSAMRDATGKNPKSRPGGGAYSDQNPNEQLNKSHFISYQNRMLPDYVTEIRPEIENLPDVVYGKTVAGTCFETSLYLASGANAMSYALLMNDTEDRSFHREMLSAFSSHRSYWEQLAAASRNTVQGGLCLVLPDNMWKRQLESGEKPFAWSHEFWASYTGFGNSMISRSGFPLSFDTPYNPVYLLNERIAGLLSDNDIKKLLSSPVLCDGGALMQLCQRGYGKHFSAYAKETDISMLYEKFMSHPINEGMEGKSWSQSFFYTKGHTLFDRTGETELVTSFSSNSRMAKKISDSADLPFGIASAIVKTDCGAKWAVFGSSPWNAIISQDKKRQLLGAADYISGNRMPAVLLTPMQAVMLPRESFDGKTTSVTLINCTIGSSPEVQLKIRNPKGSDFFVSDSNDINCKLIPVKTQDGYIVTLNRIEPWSMCTVFCK